jgi:catechol 2,3-dioxygenase-like lactoylglutathione lyase family enzyme
MDNVLVVVEDIEAAKAFFAELGMELEGQTLVEGPWVDQTCRARRRPCRHRHDADPRRPRPS